MPLTQEHDLHKRRKSRNFGLLAVLLAFVGLVFFLTVVKVTVLDPARNGTRPDMRQDQQRIGAPEGAGQGGGQGQGGAARGAGEAGAAEADQ